jgi:undecaprenyl-diphosphatase
MTTVQAIILGLVQGLTEFLPISSSAHLILGSRILGWPDQGLHFDMAANSGSLLAVMIYLRRDLAELGGGLADLSRGRGGPRGTAAAQVLVATVPVAVAGLALQTFVATEGRSLWLLGLTSLVFGLLLAWADHRPSADTGTEGWSWRHITWVGLAQAVAVLPGTSRSGVTMPAGLLGGMSRERAAHLSFVLAVPVGLLVGTAASAVSGYLAIDWLLRWVHRRNFAIFAVYRVILGIVLLVMAAV